MKKILALILAFAMVLSFSACGTKEDAEEKEADYEAFYYSLEGEYCDTYSGRAVMTVSNASKDGIHILVHWSSSWNEYTYWEMDAAMDSEGHLAYTNCKNANCVSETEDGKETEDVIYENGEGYFEWHTDEYLYWTGAADEDCRDCAFYPEALLYEEDESDMIGFYESLVGTYTDTYSERAVMEITDADAQGFHVTVHWADGAEAYRFWEMDVAIDDNGHFAYTNCKCTDYTKPAEDGKEETQTVIYENGCGYFEWHTDEYFYWTGAAEEDCRDCAFFPDNLVQ